MFHKNAFLQKADKKQGNTNILARLLAVLMIRIKKDFFTLFLATLLAALVSEWLFITARRDMVRATKTANSKHTETVKTLIQQLQMQMELRDVKRSLRLNSEETGGVAPTEND